MPGSTSPFAAKPARLQIRGESLYIRPIMDIVRVKYHKDQANELDYSHEGFGLDFKKWQTDNVTKHMNCKEVEQFVADKDAAKTAPKKYVDGITDAPKKDL
ncbi:hypothetical protein RBB50_012558 [Rhinocladiella similis]